MANPFDDPDALYLVLINTEDQCSLWPAFAGIPGGWVNTFGPASRQECLNHVEVNWTDLRPKSLAEATREI